MIDDGDFIVQHVGIAFVQVHALPYDALVVPVQRSAADIVVAGAFEAACLDQQHVVAAVAVLVDPSADRITRKHRVCIHIIRKVAPVGMNAAIVVDVFHQNVRGVRHDDDLHGRVGVHDSRHAGRQAFVGRVAALSARFLVGEVALVDGLILCGQRHFLQPAGRLGWIESTGARVAFGAVPLAFQVGILRVVERLRSGCGQQRRDERGRSDRASEKHVVLPALLCPSRRVRSVARDFFISHCGGDARRWRHVCPLGIGDTGTSRPRATVHKLHHHPGHRKASAGAFALGARAGSARLRRLGHCSKSSAIPG